MNRNLLTALIGVVGMMGLAGTLNAALITNVEVEAFSSQWTGREAINTVNGSGLDGGTHSSSNANMWMTGGGTDVAPWSITFDLVENNVKNYNLDSFHVWNYNDSLGSYYGTRSANEVQISITDSVGGIWTILDGDSGTGGVQNFFFNPGTGSSTYSGQSFDLSTAGADNVRLIRFDILSNHGSTTDYVGLSEVQFSGTAIPEPASFLLLLAGFGLMFRRPRHR